MIGALLVNSTSMLTVGGGTVNALALSLSGTPPTAVDDAAFAEAGGAAILIDVLANDSGDNLTLSEVTLQSGSGTPVQSGSQVQFTPPGSAGTSVIRYRASNIAGSNSALLTVTITEAATDNDFGDPPSSNTGPEALLMMGWS